MPRSRKPFHSFTLNRATFDFYLGDCVEVLSSLPAHSLDAIVTSPPYNLGVRYRSYDDALPRAEYLQWTGRWIERAKNALTENGSLFLNVGAKPTDPWTAIDVAPPASSQAL